LARHIGTHAAIAQDEVRQDRKDRLARGALDAPPIRRLPSRGNTSPFTQLLTFFRCVPLGTLHPRLVISDASVFSLLGVGCCCAAPATHQAQGSWTPRSRARRPPLAPSVPQKTLGSLPRPSGYILQMTWLPLGSNVSRAHGRGVTRLHHPVGGHMAQVETGTKQIGWLLTSASPSLRSQPNCRLNLSQKLSSPQKAPGLASCHNTLVPTYGPGPSGPGPCCCGSWPAGVGKSAGRPAESAGQTAPLP
jgi:hypothetical protein